MRWSLVIASSSCFALLACATAETTPSGPPPDWKLASASMSAGNNLQAAGGNGGQLSLQIDGRNLTGPTIKLYVGGGAIRGISGPNQNAQVTIDGDSARGIVGSTPFTCNVTTNPDGSAHVTGTMGARGTDFTISPKQITGRIAGLTYNLSWSGQRYDGRVDPGGAAYIALPALMATWTNAEVVCLLSVLLT